MQAKTDFDPKVYYLPKFRNLFWKIKMNNSAASEMNTKVEGGEEY